MDHSQIGPKTLENSISELDFQIAVLAHCPESVFIYDGPDTISSRVAELRLAMEGLRSMLPCAEVIELPTIPTTQHSTATEIAG